MNNERRNEMKNARKRYDDAINQIKNNINQIDILKIAEEIEDIGYDIEAICSDEEFAFDMLSPGLQATERGTQMESCINAMTSIVNDLIIIADDLRITAEEGKIIDISIFDNKVDFDWFESEATPIRSSRRGKIKPPWTYM